MYRFTETEDKLSFPLSSFHNAQNGLEQFDCVDADLFLNQLSQSIMSAFIMVLLFLCWLVP